MACLYKRKDKYWISYYYGDRQIQKSLKTSDLKVANAKKKRIEYELSLGDLHVASKLQLPVVLEAFCKHIEATRTFKSFKNDISRLRTFFGPVCESLQLGYPGKKENEILFNGKNIKSLRTDQLVAEGISLVPEGRRVFPTMTVLENIQMGAFQRRDKASINKDIDMVFSIFPQLKERIKQKAGTLSTGEQQMLAIGRALMLKPRLLLADEPSLGLSPNFVELIFDKLKEINKNGASILLVEQNAVEALNIANRAYVFSIGEIVLRDKPENLLNNEEIKKTFLGIS